MAAYFTGETIINMRVMSESKNVTLHVNDLQLMTNLIEIYSNNSNSKLNISGFGVDEDKDFFIIFLNSPLLFGDEIKIRLAYQGEYQNKNKRGLYYR